MAGESLVRDTKIIRNFFVQHLKTNAESAEDAHEIAQKEGGQCDWEL